jgi:hypothetical protein
MPERNQVHPWDRAVEAVAEETPRLVERVYQRLANPQPPGSVKASREEMVDYYWEKLYGASGGALPDLEALGELYATVGEDDLSELLKALRAREREYRAAGAPPEQEMTTDAPNPTGY